MTFGYTSGAVTYSGNISGSGSINKSGGISGTLVVLSGTNSFSGGITNTGSPSGGTLQVGSTLALGSTNGAVTISSGTLDLHSFSPSIGSLAGAGIVENFSASTTSTLTIGGTGTGAFTGKILNGSGIVALVKTGNGTLTLSGSNLFGGGMTLANGTLNLDAVSAAGTGSITITGGTLGNIVGSAVTLSTTGAEKWNGDFAFAGTNDLSVGTGAVTMSSSRTVTVLSNNFTVGGIISGSTFSLTKAGNGTLILNGANTYSGGTKVNGGLLEFGASGDIPGTGNITINGGGALVVAGAYTTAATWLTSNKIATSSAGALALVGADNETVSMGSWASLSLGASGAATFSGTLTPAGTTYELGGGGGTLTFSPTLTGSYSVAITGPGTVVLSSGSNTYNGGTTVSGGTLQAGNINALGSTSGTAAISSGLLDLHGNNVGVGAISGTGTIDNLAGSTTSTLTVGNGNTTSTFSGTIKNTTGVLALSKTGTGVLQLDGNNTYTGATTVQQGTLAGKGTLASTVTVNSGGCLAPGDNTSGNYSGAGTLTMTGLTLNTDSSVDLDLGASSDLVNVTGTLTLSGGTVNVTAGSGFGYGNYEIMSYGTLSGNIGNLTVGTMPGGYSAVLVSTGSQINLDVSGAVLTWTGSQNSSWDTTTVNWSSSGGTATYADTDSVVFDDSAGGANGTVILSGTTFSPTSISVNNSTVSYTLSGNGAIGGSTSLTKSGGGTLIIAMAGNTYSGGTYLDAGVLQIAADSTLSGGTVASGPLGTGTLALSGGTLQDDGNGRTVANPISILGNVTLASAGASGLTLSGNTLAITGSPTITVTAPTTIGDQITGGSLVLAGASTLTLTAATNTYTGPTLVEGGSLVGNVANIPTAVTLSNNANVTYNQTSAGTLNVAVSGTGSLTKAGGSVLTIGTASLSYSGNTIVSNGTLQLGAPGYLASRSPSALGWHDRGGPTTTGAILDTSGNSYNGTMTGAGANYVAGHFNQGMQLNGQYVDVPKELRHQYPHRVNRFHLDEPQPVGRSQHQRRRLVLRQRPRSRHGARWFL